MTKSQIIDAHQHFWDPAVLRLPPPAPEAAILNRAYLPDDLRREIEKVGVNYTVLVQSYPQSLSMNRWLFRLADMTDYVIGVVAWMNLENPAAAGTILDELQREPKFAGIRHIVEDETDEKWMVRAPVLESLRELSRRDVPFDMLVKPQHLKYVLTVLDEVPGLRMVIDHIGKPAVAQGGSPGWQEALAVIAKYPQVHCKLSGMITQADWQSWQPADLRPYVHHVIETFGWDRVMFGSDWPVCLLAGNYRQVWNAINGILSNASADQKTRIFGTNAVQFYKLRV